MKGLRTLTGLMLLVFATCGFGQPLHLTTNQLNRFRQAVAVSANDTSHVIILWHLARYYTMTDPHQAVLYANKAIDQAKKLQYTYGELVSLQALSFVSTITGDWQTGMQTAYEGLRISQANYPALEVAFYNLIALVYEKQQDSKRRLEWLLKAYHHPQCAGLPNNGKWLVYHNLGEVYETLNTLDSAMYFAQLVDTNCRRLNILLEVSYANAIMGRVEQKRKNYAQALTYFRIAIHFSDKVGNSFLTSEQSADIASTFKAVNQPDSAIYYATKALAGGQYFKNLVLKARAAKQLSQLHQSKNPSKAITYLNLLIATNDSLYSANRITQTQTIVNAEQRRQQDLIAAKKEYDHSLRQNTLVGSIIFLTILLVILLYTNRQKQKGNADLVAKNREISRQRDEIGKIVEQKQILLSELQHRVKNNLQYVISLLEIQKESVSFSSIDEVIRTNQNRIHSIALLHKKLQISESVNEVDLTRYVTELAELVKESYESKTKRISLLIGCKLESLSIAKALPVGLIIVELVSNSMKHAFKNQPTGLISIEIGPADQHGLVKCLHYIDNGEGFDFTKVKTNGLGIEIIKGLIDQINGQIETQYKKGFELKIYY